MFVLIETTGNYDDTWRTPIFVSHSEETLCEKMRELQRLDRIFAVVQKKVCRFIRKYDANNPPSDSEEFYENEVLYTKRHEAIENYKLSIGIPENECGMYDDCWTYTDADKPFYSIERVSLI
jgi:hypothetical protein